MDQETQLLHLMRQDKCLEGKDDKQIVISLRTQIHTIQSDKRLAQKTLDSNNRLDKVLALHRQIFSSCYLFEKQLRHDNRHLQ